MADNVWSSVASAGGSVLGSIFSGLFGNSQQKKQNQFAAEQAELDRQFQAEQAELANQFTTSERLASQQWEEDWYNNYSSPQAMVSQYEDAGLNPALMYGQAGASTGDVASAPSGESGAYASGSKATPLQGLSSLDYLQFAVDAFDKITSSINVINQTMHQRQINDWYDSEMELDLEERRSRILLNQAKETGVYEEVLNSRVGRVYTKAQIRNLSIQGDWYREQINKIKSDIGLNDANISKIGAEMALCVQSFEQRNGFYPYELLQKELDVSESEAKKDVQWLIPQTIALMESNKDLNDIKFLKDNQDLYKEKFLQAYRERFGYEFGSNVGTFGEKPLFNCLARILIDSSFNGENAIIVKDD